MLAGWEFERVAMIFLVFDRKAVWLHNYINWVIHAGEFSMELSCSVYQTAVTLKQMVFYEKANKYEKYDELYCLYARKKDKSAYCCRS
jgi:hypothetical protein